MGFRGRATGSCGSRRPARPAPADPAVAHYQRKDHFHQRAQREGFRSRAAYKLEQIDRAQRLLSSGQRVVDLGCWPGGWLQVASRAVGVRGRVVGVDRAAIEPPLENENVIALVGDLEEGATRERILEALGGKAHVLLCDAAPKLTGVRDVDRAAEERILLSVENLIPQLLQANGSLLLKLLESPEARQIELRMRRHFGRAKSVKPAATRKGSSERYLLARGYAPE